MVQEEISLLFRPILITLTYALKRPCGIILCGLGAPHEAAKVLTVQPRPIDGIGLEHYFQSQMKTA